MVVLEGGSRFFGHWLEGKKTGALVFQRFFEGISGAFSVRRPVSCFFDVF